MGSLCARQSEALGKEASWADAASPKLPPPESMQGERAGPTTVLRGSDSRCAHPHLLMLPLRCKGSQLPQALRALQTAEGVIGAWGDSGGVYSSSLMNLQSWQLMLL